MGRIRTLLLTALLWPGIGTAADPPVSTPAPAATITAELEQASEFLRTALDDALAPGLTVVDVETGYLAGQGVLVIADLARPWYRLDGGAIDIDADITSLEQIPDLVHDVLRELDLGLSRHQVEDLQALRGLRDAQQAVRAERRALRGELRELRRQRMAAEAAGATAELAELDRQLMALEAQLETAAERERSLEREAARQRGATTPAQPPVAPPAPAKLDRAVSRAVCDNVIGFSAVAGDEHLNVVVRQADTSRYYVFALQRVRACQSGDIAAAELLAQSTSTSWR
jgi:hypothetical protein